MNPYYVITVLGTGFAMLAMVVGVQSNIFLEKSSRNNFQRMFILLAIANVSEMAAALIVPVGVMRSLFYLAKTTELLSTPLIPIFAVMAIGRRKNIKIGKIIIGMNILLQLISLFTGVIYSVDEFGSYHRGVLYGLYVVIFVIAVIYTIVECVNLCKEYQVNNIPFLIMLVILSAIAILMPFSSMRIRLDWVYTSIAAILFYIFYNQLIMQADDLTKLLNRRSFDCSQSGIDETLIVIVLDVNGFKGVNDKFGHLYGDECLKKIGADIRRSFGKYGNCYRIGGDEFCVLIKCEEDIVQKQIEMFDLKTKLRISEDENFPSCAIGYSIFNPEKNSIMEVFGKADRAMYQNKESAKKK